MSKIKNFEKLEQTFGYNPYLHDDVIKSLTLEDRDPIRPSLRLVIWPTDNESTSRYTMMFREVRELQMENFEFQNVIREIVINETKNGLDIVFLPSVGLELSFKCKEAEVTDLIK